MLICYAWVDLWCLLVVADGCCQLGLMHQWTVLGGDEVGWKLTTAHVR